MVCRPTTDDWPLTEGHVVCLFFGIRWVVGGVGAPAGWDNRLGLGGLVPAEDAGERVRDVETAAPEEAESAGGAVEEPAAGDESGGGVRGVRTVSRGIR